MERILRSKNDQVHCEYKNMGQYVWSHLQQLNPRSVCLIDARTDEHLTVSELKSRANSIAMALIKRGIVKTDIIAFCGQNSIQHSIVRVTAYLLGNTILPLSLTASEIEVKNTVTDVGVNVIMSSAKHLNKFNEVLNNNNNKQTIKFVVVFDGLDNNYLTYEQLLYEERDHMLERIPYFDVCEEDIAILAQTSGTSGPSKCAMLSNRMNILGTKPGNRSLMSGITYPLGHSSGTQAIISVVLNGSTVVLFDEFDKQLIFKSIEKYKIQIILTFPNFCEPLLKEMDAKKYDLTSMELLMIGAGSIAPHIAYAVINKFGKLFIRYCMTECSAIASMTFLSDDQYIPGCVGQITPGMEVKIIDMTTGESLSAGIDGEVCVRGKYMSSGYLKNMEMFDSEGWFRTGDIGHYDDEERLFLTDRVKEVIRIAVDNNYLNISPVDIEHFLSAHKSIADAVVVGVNNSAGTQWPRAYVVLEQGQFVTEKDIQQYVSESLSSTKQLKAGVVFVEHIHRTGSEKIDRKYYRNVVKDEIIE